jgi:hypothetical protein
MFILIDIYVNFKYLSLTPTTANILNGLVHLSIRTLDHSSFSGEENQKYSNSADHLPGDLWPALAAWVVSFVASRLHYRVLLHPQNFVNNKPQLSLYKAKFSIKFCMS